MFLKQLGVKFEIFNGSLRHEARTKLINDYNRNVNQVLLFTSAMAEGVDLKETNCVHIVEPQWHEEKIQQVIGRARRYGSHADPNSVVHVFRYVSVLTDPTVDAVSADEYLDGLSRRKDRVNQKFMDRLIGWSEREGCLNTFVF